MDAAGMQSLWRFLRRAAQDERRNLVSDAAASLSVQEDPSVLLELADLMIESSVSFFGMPLGVSANWTINSIAYCIPMATEEPSVIAAASFAAGLLSRAGGLQAEADEPVMTGQIFFKETEAAEVNAIPGFEQEVGTIVDAALPGMKRRGGGFRGLDVHTLPETGIVRVHVYIHVCDAMGANAVNTAVEKAAAWIETRCSGTRVMAILSNSADRRIARASFRMPVSLLRSQGMGGMEAAERIVLAASIAAEDPHRAVTHNKGIMNGITALALATGNDTRGIEAAVHAFAAREGRYTALSRYHIEDECLCGSIELPMPIASAGGAAGIHPCAQFSLGLLGRPGAQELACIAASLGLAQNLAALRALVSEGIQHGHMKLHARRVAYAAGARGAAVQKVADRIWRENNISTDRASEVLAGLDI